MEKGKMEININVTDWQDEYMDAEPVLINERAAIETQQRDGIGPHKMGRLLVVGREMGQAPSEILPPCKSLLNIGAAYKWSQLLAERKTTATLSDGRELEVREFVADVRQDTEEGEDPEPFAAPVRYDDPKAIERARDYLLNRVPGYVYGRLAIIAANGGDVAGAADGLKAAIDGMVARLVQPVVE